MKNELKLEFKRCLNSKKFKFCFAILFALVVLSYLMLFKQVFHCNSLELQKTTEYSMIINSGDIRNIYLVFIISAPLLTICMYSDTYIEQRNSNMYTLFLSRIGKKKYFLSKVITIAVVTFFSIFLILAFNEILTWITVPNVGIQRGMPAYFMIDNNETEFFLQSIYDKSPHVYNFIIIIITAFFCMISSLLAFNLSMIFNINRTIMIIISFLIVNSTMMILPEEYQMQMYMQTWPASAMSFIITICIWILLIIYTFILGMKKEIL